MDFAMKIKSYRKQNAWTQQDVAEKLGVSRKTISSWENGRSYPDIFMLVQLSDLYHVNLDDLLREDHKMINNYKKEHVANTKKDREFVISYLLNLAASLYFLCRALVGPSFISQLQPGWRLIIGILFGLLTVNVYFLLSRANWKAINRTDKVGIILTFLVVAALLIKADSVSLTGNDYNFGTGFGRGFVLALSALSIVEAIWLYRQFKERRNR